MLTHIKDGAIALFFICASFAVLGLWQLGIAENSRLKASHDRIDAVAASIAENTARSLNKATDSMEHLQMGVNQNLWAITDPDVGHLERYRLTLKTGMAQFNGHLHTIDQQISGLVSGTMTEDQDGQVIEKRGLLDLSDSLAEVLTRTAIIEGKFAHDFLDCEKSPDTCAAARLDRFSARLAALQENGLGITSQVNDTLPLFLDCTGNPGCIENRWNGLSKAIEGTSQDIHSYVHTFTSKKSLPTKMWDVLVLGAKGCIAAC